jgi:hypothetical protein
MYLYVIDRNSHIDFEKLKKIKYGKIERSEMTEDILRGSFINDKHDVTFAKTSYKEPVPGIVPDLSRMKYGLKAMGKKEDIIKIDQKVDLTASSGASLLALTEAPTDNIIKWASAVYESNGVVKKMLSTGYHEDLVWENLLFQLVYAFAVLQEKLLYVKNMSFEKNIFIKDIFNEGSMAGFWRYNVNGLPFYIPNLGSIVMIDTMYNAIINNSSSGIIEEYKIVSPRLYSQNGDDFKGKNDDYYKKKIFEQFKSMVNPDNFTRKWSELGAIKPGDAILALLDGIHNDKEEEISNYLFTYFKNYLHPRVGSLVSKIEMDNINMVARPKLINGNLIVFQSTFNEYRWGIYLRQDLAHPLRHIILTKQNGIFVEKEVFAHSLYHYPEGEKLAMPAENNTKLSYENLLETYTF